MKKLITPVVLVLVLCVFLPGCRNYDSKVDIAYAFKTEPEKAVIDFLHAVENNDPAYIHKNLMLNKDRNSISSERFAVEFSNILSDVSEIEIIQTIYLGYENEMSKVVAEFYVTYQNGEKVEYKKYIYLEEENNYWKIVFEKTFI